MNNEKLGAAPQMYAGGDAKQANRVCLALSLVVISIVDSGTEQASELGLSIQFNLHSSAVLCIFFYVHCSLSVTTCPNQTPSLDCTC